MNTPETPSIEPQLTAGQLAKQIGRSGYGVKKAIQRLGIAPKQQLGGISYYDATIAPTVLAAMRGANLQTQKL